MHVSTAERTLVVREFHQDHPRALVALRRFAVERQDHVLWLHLGRLGGGARALKDRLDFQDVLLEPSLPLLDRLQLLAERFQLFARLGRTGARTGARLGRTGMSGQGDRGDHGHGGQDGLQRAHADAAAARSLRLRRPGAPASPRFRFRSPLPLPFALSAGVSGRSTSSSSTVGAPSPGRTPAWMIRVYPPLRSAKRAAIVSNIFRTTSSSGTMARTWRRAWRFSRLASVIM